MKTTLPTVTLIAVAGNKHGATIAALNKSLEQIEPARTVFITNIDMVVPGIEVVYYDGLRTWQEYNHFIVKELHKHFNTSHCLLIQWDGYVLDGNQWDDQFLIYDYIGAKWFYKDHNVGNGGFSIRSKRLQEILANDSNIILTSPEDECICRLYAPHLEHSYDIQFAPEELADKFSFELNPPLQKTFGFHGFHHKPFRQPLVLKRSFAMGDVIMLEPLMDYIDKKGFQVVLDMSPWLMALFTALPYKVIHLSEMQAKTKTFGLDFDMSYEKKPQQLALQSYYEHVGVTDGTIRNSNLNYFVPADKKLFKKYAVVHINKTDLPYRNIHNVDWREVERYLRAEGYTVLQIGESDGEIGDWINTQDIQTLLYVIGGADLFIGSDSGPSHIAVGCNVPSVIMAGSVNLAYRYADFKNIRVVQNDCVKAGCYHSVISEKGTDCIFNKELPPCTQYSAHQIISKIKEFDVLDITFPGVIGNKEIYMDVLNAILGDTERGSMIDLGCNLAPHTPLLGFKKRKYIDILPRVLDHPAEQQYYMQADILETPLDQHYDVSFSLDVIEHLTEYDGLHLLKIMDIISDRQILFTPLDDIFGMDHETNNPEAHRSLWSKKMLESIMPNHFAYIFFPDYHKVWNGGAFFFWHAKGIRKDFERVRNILKQKAWARL